MNPDSRGAKRAILISVAVQLVAWVGAELLETLVGGLRIGILVAMQIAWPIWLTLDTTFNWSKVPAFRQIAVILNFLYAFMTGLGIVAAVVGVTSEASWLAFGRLALWITITTTYLVNAFVLMPSLRLRRTEDQREPPGGENK